MYNLKLVRPTKEYEKQVMQYKEEFLKNNDSLDGCAGLEEIQNYDEWLEFDKRLAKKWGESYVPSNVYLCIRVQDNKLVGINHTNNN